MACTCIRGCCWNMRGREDIPRQRYAKKMCNLEADFMARHTNTGGGAKLYILNVSCVAPCHLTTEIGILTRFTMQSRGQFVVGSGGGGHGGNCFFCASSVRPATFRLLDRLEMPSSSKQDRAFIGLCNLRPLTRWYDPEPLGGMWPASILKTQARGAMVKWAALATVGGPKLTPARHHRACGQFHTSCDSCSDGGCHLHVV